MTEEQWKELIEAAPEATEKPPFISTLHAFMDKPRPILPKEWKGVRLNQRLRLVREGRGEGGAMCFLRELGVHESKIQWFGEEPYPILTEVMVRAYTPV